MAGRLSIIIKNIVKSGEVVNKMKAIWFFFSLWIGSCAGLKPKWLPKTDAQSLYQSMLEDSRYAIVVAEGPAGTGKTALAVQQALLSLHDNTNKIILTRPIVSPDQGIGFLKGDLNQKMDPWVAPVLDVMKEFHSTSKIRQWMKEGTIEIAPFSFLRGRTFKNAFVIADEVQNATPAQVKLLLTRLGENSKMILTGDLSQSDLYKKVDGLRDLMGRIKDGKKGIGLCRFQNHDVQRHPLMELILEIYND